MDEQVDLKALSEGSVKDFDTLFRLYYPKAKVFLASILGNDEEAEDLAQDTFVRLWQRREGLVMVHNLNAYIYQIVKNILFTHLEKQKRYASVSLDDTHDIMTTEDVEKIVFAKELEKIINVTIEQMPPQRKRVFCMSRREGHSIEEISKELGISKRTVETHISAALVTLRKVIMSLICLLLS